MDRPGVQSFPNRAPSETPAMISPSACPPMSRPQPCSHHHTVLLHCPLPVAHPVDPPVHSSASVDDEHSLRHLRLALRALQPTLDSSRDHPVQRHPTALSQHARAATHHHPLSCARPAPRSEPASSRLLCAIDTRRHAGSDAHRGEEPVSHEGTLCRRAPHLSSPPGST